MGKKKGRTSRKIKRQEHARKAATPWRPKSPPVDVKMQRVLRELSPEERLGARMRMLLKELSPEDKEKLLGGLDKE